MSRFRYVAVTSSGERVSDAIDAAERSEVIARLSQLGHFPLEVVEVNPGDGDAAATLSQSLQDGGNRAAAAQLRLSAEDITLFTRELAMLLSAGLTLAQGLRMLAVQANGAKASLMANRAAARLADGASLEAALSQSGAFPDLYLNMVRVGEATGTVQSVLERLAAEREREAKLRAKIVSALIYPAFLTVTAIAALLFILTVVVPRFKEVLAGVKPDGAAGFVFALSDWLVVNGAYLALASAISVLIFGWALRTASVRARLLAFALSVPFVGGLIRMDLTVRFARTLGLLLENGINLPEALKLTGSVLGNARAAAVVDDMGHEVRRGHDFLQPLSQAKLLPPLAMKLLQVGAETGKLASAANHLANLYQDKLEVAIQRLLALLEPVIIVLVSLATAGIVLSIMDAVMSVNDMVFV